MGDSERNGFPLRPVSYRIAIGSMLRSRTRKLMNSSSNQQQQRRKRQSGFTLMELLIVISIMLILMLIAIPNFSSMRSQANETSAIQSLRAISAAEIQYSTTYPANGFACSLASLGGNQANEAPTAQAAHLLPSDLTSGQKSGYTFNIVNCSKVTVNNQDQITSFEVTAVPQAVGKTGHRGFCLDQFGEIKSDPKGGTNCTESIK